MKRVTCIVLSMVMVLMLAPVAVAEGQKLEQQNVDISAKLTTEIAQNNTSIEVTKGVKSVEVPEVDLMGLSSNTGADWWIRFPTTDLTDVTQISTATADFSCLCYDGENAIYAMSYGTNYLYRIPFDSSRGIVGVPQKLHDFYNASGVASAIAYKKNTGDVLVVFNANELYMSPVNSRKPEKLCDIYEGAVAIGTSNSGMVYAINAFGVFGVLNSSTGQQSQLVNTGIAPYDGSFYLQCGSVSNGYFYWNAVTAADCSSSVCVIDISKKECVDLGNVLEAPGVRFWGLFPVPEITVIAPDAPDEFNVFYENWEFGTAQWSFVDNDGDGNCWTVGRTNVYAQFDDGNFVLNSPTYDSEGNALTPNDWVISNPIALPTEVPSYLTIWITTILNDTPHDYFQIYIAGESYESVDDFVLAYDGELTDSSKHHFEVDLTDYMGQTINVAICHKNAAPDEGQHGVALDVVGIGTLRCFNTATFVCGMTGDVLGTDSVRYGKSPDYPKVPKFEHYEFVDWDYTGKVYEDITITSVYDPDDYTVFYMIDGSLYNLQTVDYGTVIQLIDAPARPGFTFNGWENVPETMPAEDVYLNGSYTAGVYTITFVDGHTDEVISTLSLGYGEEVIYPDAPEHDGYIFTGWSETITTAKEDITITAMYMEEPEGIIGDPNGDGSVNTGDAVMVLRHAVGSIELTAEQMRLADFTGDGNVNTGDATAILRFVVA